MINANETEYYKNITKVILLDSKLVFYPISYVLQKRDIIYDDDLSCVIIPIPEDIKYPSASKLTDGGTIRDYKIDISVNNQLPGTQAKLEKLENRKVIIVLYHGEGKTIIGCNEMPLDYLLSDDNTTNPAGENGFSIMCRGNSYYLKVSL